MLSNKKKAKKEKYNYIKKITYFMTLWIIFIHTNRKQDALSRANGYHNLLIATTHKKAWILMRAIQCVRKKIYCICYNNAKCQFRA